MTKYTLQLIVPVALRGIRKEIERIQSYNADAVFVEVTGECNDIKSFQEWSTKKEIPNFILIFEGITEARTSKEKAREELLELVSNLCFRDSKLIFILSESQKEELLPFVNELIKLDLQNFYFTKEFRTTDLASWIFESKTLHENMEFVVRKLEPKTKVVTKEVIRYVTNEEADKSIVASNVRNIRKRSTHIIGFFGSGGGIGCTAACIELAKCYAKENYKVAIVERNGSGQLRNIRVSKNIDIFTDFPLAGINMKNYNHIIIDFGVYAQIHSSGEFIKENVDSIKQQQRDLEMQFCNHIVLVASAELWREKETEFYFLNPIFEELTQDWIFYLRHTTEDIKEFLKKCCRERMVVSDLSDGIEGLRKELDAI